MNNQFGREVKCSRCWAPWYGYGTICNECRQIEALGEISSKSQQTSYTGTGTGTSRGVSASDFFGLFPAWVLWATFFIFSYLTDWWPIKIIWIVIKLGIHGVFVQWSGIGWDWVWL